MMAGWYSRMNVVTSRASKNWYPRLVFWTWAQIDRKLLMQHDPTSKDAIMSLEN